MNFDLPAASPAAEKAKGQSVEVVAEHSRGQSAEVVTSLVPSAPALIDTRESVPMATQESGGAVREYQVIYPKLDSHTEGGYEVNSL